MKNGIKGLKITREWEEELNKIKDNKNFFNEQFEEKDKILVNLYRVHFPSISFNDNKELIIVFTKEEFRSGECEESKCYDPNGYKFNFIKHHWDTLKGS